MARYDAAVRDIAQGHGRGDTVALFSHGAAIRVYAALAAGLDAGVGVVGEEAVDAGRPRARPVGAVADAGARHARAVVGIGMPQPSGLNFQWIRVRVVGA